MRKLKGNFN